MKPKLDQSVWYNHDDPAEISNKEPWLNAFHPDEGLLMFTHQIEQHRLQKLFRLLHRFAASHEVANVDGFLIDVYMGAI